MEIPRSIAIVGGGVRGMTVALELIRAFDGARLRRSGTEPSVTLYNVQRDSPRSGLVASSAVSAFEVLAHVPTQAPGDAQASASVRVRTVSDAVAERLRPVRIGIATLQKKGGFSVTPLSESNVPHNIGTAVDLMLDAGAPPGQVGTALDLYLRYMHKDVSARSHVRDNCPEVTALLDPRTAFGRLQRCLGLAVGAGRPGPQATLHSAASAGVLWPAEHADGGMPTGAQPGMWRFEDAERDVLLPMRRLVRSLGVKVVEARVEATTVVSGGVVVRTTGSDTTYDLVVDAKSPRQPAVQGVLWLSPFLAREYRRRAGPDLTVLHPESPWRLVTNINSKDEVECWVGAGDAPGIRAGTLREASPDTAAVEVMLQLGFSLSDASGARWVVVPAPGPREPLPTSPICHGAVPRELLAFEVGISPVVVGGGADGVRDRPSVVGRLVHCRTAATSRQGGAGTLGPSFEAAKLTVQQLVYAMAMQDRMRAATAGPNAPLSDTLVSVPGQSETVRRMLPAVFGGQRWALFNHLAQRLRVGYRIYVGQVVLATCLSITVVLLVIVLPVVTVQRARKRRVRAPPTPLTLTTG
jgi:hypothetical protein